MEKFNINESCKSQSALQKEHNYPQFAPINGICYRCKKQIYSEINHGTYATGIDTESASKSLITSCPHCNMSYCD
jgi:hypothetical protein